MSGATVDGMNCRDASTAFYLMAIGKLPYCSRPSFLTPPPDCFTPAQRAPIVYCGQYPQSNGPDKNLNAFCWGARHDATYWDSLVSRRTCRPPDVRELPPRPPAPPPVRPPAAPPPTRTAPPPVRTTPPPVRTAPPPVRTTPPPVRPPVMTPPEPPMYEPPAEEAPPEPDHRESSMMGLWGILALVAVGGGGYYLYRKYKR